MIPTGLFAGSMGRWLNAENHRHAVRHAGVPENKVPFACLNVLTSADSRVKMVVSLQPVTGEAKRRVHDNGQES